MEFKEITNKVKIPLIGIYKALENGESPSTYVLNFVHAINSPEFRDYRKNLGKAIATMPENYPRKKAIIDNYYETLKLTEDVQYRIKDNDYREDFKNNVLIFLSKINKMNSVSKEVDMSFIGGL